MSSQRPSNGRAHVGGFSTAEAFNQPSVIRWVGNENKKVYEFSPKVIGRLNAKEQNLELIRKAWSTW